MTIQDKEIAVLSDGYFLCALFPGKQRLEYGPDEGLDEEQLGEEREGEIVAYQLQPGCQKREDVEAPVIRGVQPCGNEAH